MKIDERVVVTQVSRFESLDVLVANKAMVSYRLLRPMHMRIAVVYQPYVGQDSRPSSVSIDERMNLHGTMVQPGGLLYQIDTIGFPEPEVFQEVV